MSVREIHIENNLDGNHAFFEDKDEAGFYHIMTMDNDGFMEWDSKFEELEMAIKEAQNIAQEYDIPASAIQIR